MKKECKYFAQGFPNAYILSELCTEQRGKQGGRPAQCYKEMSVFYRIIDWLKHPIETAACALGKGLEHMGGIED